MKNQIKILADKQIKMTLLSIHFKLILISFLSVFFFDISLLHAGTFKIVSYNVENLFDLVKSGTEYEAYIPNTRHGWNREMASIKTANIAKVIKDLKADVVVLQEIESKQALMALNDRLKETGRNYPYIHIATGKRTPVTCAILSVFPIIEKKEMEVDDERLRDILKVTLDIHGNPMVLFVNHWKSKRGPESMRITSAKVLRQAMDTLNTDADFILIGDFNSNYNEYKTFLNKKKLNDTNGITGINHILNTIKDAEMVSETILTNQSENRYMYNLWLEVRKYRRWSYNFFGKKGTPDNMILSKGLYDDHGISYIDNSFYKFHPNYLFKDRAIYRWQIAQKGKGRHLGNGYSDHLPIFAYFSTDPFQFKTNTRISDDFGSSKVRSIIRLDLNAASQEALKSISGIGSVLSERIVAGRPYGSVDDLIKINGIGPQKLKQFRIHFFIK